MTIHEAVKALAGNSDLLATLPGERGTVPALHMGSSMQIADVRNGKARRWVPKFTDLVSIEWQVIQLSVMAKQRQQAQG